MLLRAFDVIVSSGRQSQGLKVLCRGQSRIFGFLYDQSGIPGLFAPRKVIIANTAAARGQLHGHLFLFIFMSSIFFFFFTLICF